MPTKLTASCPLQCLATAYKNYHQHIFLQHSMKRAKKASSKLWALSSFMRRQSTTWSLKHSTPLHGTLQMQQNSLLDYLVIHPTATIHYCASNMMLKVHSNDSYLNESQAWSSYNRYFFGDHQHENLPLTLNGSIFINTSILKWLPHEQWKQNLEHSFTIVNLFKN